MCVFSFLHRKYGLYIYIYIYIENQHINHMFKLETSREKLFRKKKFIFQQAIFLT
jgi:hypothetical protein